MLLTAGLSPVAQLFSGTSRPSPFELAPVAPEWPITPMASSSGVRLTGVRIGLVSTGSVDAADVGADGTFVVEVAEGSSSEPQPARARATAIVTVARFVRVVMAAAWSKACPGRDGNASRSLGKGAGRVNKVDGGAPRLRLDGPGCRRGAPPFSENPPSSLGGRSGVG